MNNKNLIKIFLFIGIFVQLSFSQQVVEAIAAVVGQEIVLKSEVDQFVQNYALQNKLDIRSNPEMLKKLQKQVLERLIEQKILLTKAEQDTIEVDDREVDKYVDEHIRYLISQVGSEDQLESIFQNPLNKIKRDLRKETADRLKIEKLRRTKFQNIKISRREIEQFYKTYKDSLPEMKETVDISHILKQIKVGEEGRENAFQRMFALKKKLDEGANFEELAKQYSEDPGTASRGGDLGFQKRGDFLQEYEETAFALKDGEISDIVQTQIGFHIIQLIERRGEKIHTRHILIRLQPTEEDEDRIIQQLLAIREQIINGANFDSLAVQYSDDENVQNDKGHLGVWEVENLAISEFKNVVKNLQVGQISEPFKTEYGYHILKLNARKEARNLTLDSDWEQIRQLALNYKIEKEYAKWISKIKEEVPIEVKITYN